MHKNTFISVQFYSVDMYTILRNIPIITGLILRGLYLQKTCPDVCWPAGDDRRTPPSVQTGHRTPGVQSEPVWTAQAEPVWLGGRGTWWRAGKDGEG